MQSICSVESCTGAIHARSWCMKHYDRWHAHGDPLVTLITRDPSIEDRLRFHGWTVVESGCWEWRGRRTREGYGKITFQCAELVVTRVVYELWVGPIPAGHLIRHACDNPPCMNPAHLLTGTDMQNTADKYARNRARTKLTAPDIPLIRAAFAAGVTQREIAEQYGVEQCTISNVITGKRWARVI